MKNSCAVILPVILLNVQAFAKSIDSAYLPKQTIHMELFGVSRSIWACNYERRIFQSNIAAFSIRTGIGRVPGYYIYKKRFSGTITVPVVATTFVGKRRHYALFGCSYAASFSKNQIDSSLNPPAIHRAFESAFIIRVGYKYISSHRDTFEIYPIFQWSDNTSYLTRVLFGISLGTDLSNLLSAISN